MTLVRRSRDGHSLGASLLGWCCALLLAGQAVADPGLPPFSYSFDVTTGRITLTPASRWMLFRESDTVSIGTTGNTTIRVLSLDGALVYQGPPTSRTFARGHYFVETPGDRTQFAVLPDDCGILEMMGVHDTGSWTQGNQVKASLGPRWERSGHGLWLRVQPTATTWDWSEMDNAMADLEGTGRKIIYIGGAGAPGVPAWISPNQPITAYTNAVVTAYTNFVARALARYGDKIYAWEVWNEPLRETLGIAEYADIEPMFLELAKATKIVRDQVAPGVKLLGPAWHGANIGDNDWLRAHGIDDILDILSWHDYDSGYYAPDRDYPNLVNLHQRVQNAYGDSLTVKPSVVGEMGVFGRSALGCPAPVENQQTLNSGISWFRGFCRAAKLPVMYKADGVVGLVPQVGGSFATYPNSNYEVFGFDYSPANVSMPRGPHPKTTSLMMSSYWINDATFVTRRSLGTNIFLYAYQRANGSALVFAWCSEDQTYPINTSVAPAATDLFGATIAPAQLTERLILFVSNSQSPAALLGSVMAALPSLNLTPVWNPVNNQTVLRDQPLQFTLSATDADQDPLTYAVSPVPAGATLNAQTGVFSWTPGATQMGTYSITCTVTDARGLSASTSTIITVLGTETDGLVAHWKLDEASGTTAADSARNNTGSLVGFNFNATSGWATGRWGNALVFDGANDRVNLNSASADLNLTNNFSIAFWVNPHQPAAEKLALALRAQYQASGLRVWIVDKSVRLEGQTVTGWHGMRFALNALPAATWYHLVVVCDKSTLKVYVDGTLRSVAPGANPNWGGNFVMNPQGHSELGGESYYDYFFDGGLDDVRVYNRCLSELEINGLYQGPTPPAPAPPVLDPIGPQGANEGQALTVVVSATDPDSPTLTYSATGLPSGASFNASTRTFSWTPGYTQAGSYPVTFTVSDGSLTDSEAVTITVNNVNRAPVLAAIGNKSVNEGQVLSFTVSATDPDGNSLSYS
ncbi:putative Ig domain-containing protein, partial [bacterium]|nr:putative Ig domain-containing protein [bacterium]